MGIAARKVYVVVVNWNGGRDTIECLESVIPERLSRLSKELGPEYGRTFTAADLGYPADL